MIEHSVARTLGVLVLAAACSSQTSPIPEDTEIKTTASGLKYSVLKGGGQGASPALEDTVRVHYTGWLTDGTEFDSSRRRGEPSSFGVGQVIDGWTEGLQLMKAGERFKFTIPSDLAYGSQGRPSIPPNSILIFDVELIAILPKFRTGNSAAQKTTASGIKWEVVKPGEGGKPADDEIVDLKFAIWTPSGQLQQCTEQGAGTLKFPLDGRAPLEFLSEAATLMRVGDRIRLEVPAGMMPSPQPTVWELELLGVMKNLVPDFSPLDPTKTTKTASGLEYEVIEAGAGDSPSATDTVTVHYAGWLTDGTAFDSSFSRGETTSFPLNRVIPGWTEGVQLMKVGAIYKFQIPGNLAYGSDGSPPIIGPNATLIFYIQLISVD